MSSSMPLRVTSHTVDVKNNVEKGSLSLIVVVAIGVTTGDRDLFTIGSL